MCQFSIRGYNINTNRFPDQLFFGIFILLVSLSENISIICMYIEEEIY